MNYPSPLTIEKKKLKVNHDNFELIQHSEFEHISLGLQYDGENHFFDLPIDITNSEFNIVYDGEYRFSFYQIHSNQYDWLQSLIGQRVEIWSLGDSLTKTDNILFKLNDEAHLVSFDIVSSDSINYLNTDFRELTTELVNFDSLGLDKKMHFKGSIKPSEIRLYSKVFESKTGNNITDRTTAETGFNLISSTNQCLVFSDPIVNSYINYAVDEEMIDILAQHKLIMNRIINE